MMLNTNIIDVRFCWQNTQNKTPGSNEFQKVGTRKFFNSGMIFKNTFFTGENIE